MSRFINAKKLIIAVFTLYFFYCCWKTFFMLGTHYSIDAAAGFLWGLMFAFCLYVQVKCIGFLYKEIQEWWSEYKATKNPYVE